MLTYHVDGGSFMEPPTYKPHDAYFSVVDDEENEVYVDTKLGDVTTNVAEYRAIKWVVDNIPERPIRIFSDSQTAIAWANRGGKGKAGEVEALDLTGIFLMHLSDNFADQYNADYISPKQTKEFYVARYLNSVDRRWNKKQKKRGLSSLK